MRVLIVEDDSEKLQKVAAAVLKGDGGGIEIESAQNAIQAKQALLKREYDLLILDVALPIRADVSATPTGGVDLLRSVSRSPRYKKPRAIIGLTAYADLIPQAGPDFNMESWTLVHFDRTSEDWISQIGRKISYLREAALNPSEREHECELCVITALYDPEFKAVLRLPWQWSRQPLNGDATQYWEGYFSRDEKRHRVVAANASRMGMTFAATLAMKMIHEFRPRYLAMVGIAAGIKGKCSLGDAIAADPCWDWGNGKFKESGGVAVFEQAPEQLNLDSFVKARLINLSQDNAALESVRSGWEAGEIATVLRMHVGPMASGAAVLADREHALLIQRQHRKVLGIDMEAYAVFAAGEQANRPRPIPFVIKGIVDFADPHKTDAHQAYASYVSASLLWLLMERY